MVLGLGLGLQAKIFGLGLGLEAQVLGLAARFLGLGLATHGLALALLCLTLAFNLVASLTSLRIEGDHTNGSFFGAQCIKRVAQAGNASVTNIRRLRYSPHNVLR